MDSHLPLTFMNSILIKTYFEMSCSYSKKSLYSFFPKALRWSRTLSSASDSSELVHNAKKRLDIAIVGAPNAGKSQLLNVLTQSTVAAVSRKRHTTRGGILGARTLDDTQLIFWDTPGFLKASSAKKEGLHPHLMLSALNEMKAVDYSLLVVDSARKSTDSYDQSLISLMNHALQSNGRDEAVFDKTYKPELPREAFGIVLNKVDLVNPKEKLLEIADDLGKMAESCIAHYLENNEDPRTQSLSELYPTMFYTNALNEEGTDDILQHLHRLATPCLKWALNPGEVSVLTPLQRLEEIVREKVYRTLHREVPHCVQQMNRSIIHREGGIVEIQHYLVVKSKSHYALIKGRNLASIQQASRRDIEESLFPGKVVVLDLQLKLNKSQHDRTLRIDSQGTVQFLKIK
jgi:GTPase